MSAVSPAIIKVQGVGEQSAPRYEVRPGPAFNRVAEAEMDVYQYGLPTAVFDRIGASGLAQGAGHSPREEEMAMTMAILDDDRSVESVAAAHGDTLADD